MAGAHRRPTVIIDECLPARRFRDFLEQRGHTVLTVGEAFPSGAPDAAVLALAVSRNAVVISTDRAFPRLERLIDDIEREYESAIEEGRTLMIRITESSFTVEK